MHIINQFGESEGRPRYLPTPAEIKRMTAIIRKTWSKDDYVIRDRIGARLPVREYRLHVSRDVISRCMD